MTSNQLLAALRAWLFDRTVAKCERIWDDDAGQEFEAEVEEVTA